MKEVFNECMARILHLILVKEPIKFDLRICYFYYVFSTVDKWKMWIHSKYWAVWFPHLFSPGKWQELDMQWFHTAHLNLSLHLQLDNQQFFGFILCCERLLQMPLCPNGTLLLTWRRLLLSGWVLVDAVLPLFLFPLPHLFPIFLLLRSLHKLRLK